MNKTRAVRMASAVFVCVAASMLIVTIGEAQSTAIGTCTIEGLVRDVACPLQKTNSTSTSYGKDCIIQCAKAGSLWEF
jgi:hypothetical protein